MQKKSRSQQFALVLGFSRSKYAPRSSHSRLDQLAGSSLGHLRKGRSVSEARLHLLLDEPQRWLGKCSLHLPRNVRYENVIAA